MTVTEERVVVREALVGHQREFRLAFEDLKQATRELADPRDMSVGHFPDRGKAAGALGDAEGIRDPA